MVTTIQVGEELKEALKKQKFSENETYEDVIWDLLEDRMELSEDTKKRIAQAEADIAAGRTYTHAEVKKRLGL